VSRQRTILVVDDEPTIAEVVASYLRREGFRAVTAGDGPSAVAAASEHEPDLAVLDVMLPGFDGLQVMAHLRRRGPLPIVLLTARGEEADRVLGLKLGADDYVVKPFSPAELVARVEAVLRRAGDVTPGDGEPVRFGDVVVDARSRTVAVRGEPVELTAREFDLLDHLSRNPGRAFSRDELMRDVWRHAFWSDTATVTVHVRRLRQKIEVDPLQPRHLVTVWGVGYRLEP
jgi:DNA-binding response OmpR family regulator